MIRVAFLTGAALTLLLLATVGTAHGCDADSAISAFEDKISSHTTVYMEYHKEARSLLFGERPPEDGKLWLGPPSRYRVETPGRTVVRGDDTLWTYFEDTKQVTLRGGDLDSLEFGPTGFFGSLRRDFFPVDCETERRGKKAVWKVRLAAKTETAAIQRLTLWIDSDIHWVLAAEYVDYNEETAILTFTDYRTDRSKDKKSFVFTAPKGVERVVLPSHSSSGSNRDEN